MSLKFPQFGTTDDVDLLLGISLQICITNIRLVNFKSIEFRKEDDEADTTKGNDA
jgi:hypothetical protein